MPLPKKKFYCFKTKKKFSTDSYGLIKKNTKRGMRYMAIAEKDGNKCVSLVTKQFYDEWNKK